MKRRLLWGPVAAALLVLVPVAALGQAATAIPAWIAPPSFAPAKPRDGEPVSYEDQSVRQDIRLRAATSRIRLRLTNEYGAEAVALAGVEMRRVAPDGSLGDAVRLSFDGRPGATIVPGAALYTDAADFAAPAFADVAVTVHYLALATPVAHRLPVRIAAGDATPPSAAAPVRGAAIVSAVETEAAPSDCRRVVVALGDSITEGAGSTANNDWPSLLGRKLAAGRCPHVVLNAGISGNKLLSNGGSPGLLARLDRDVLALPGVTDIVFVEGINDIRAMESGGGDPEILAAMLVAGYRQLVARAHAHGIRVIGGTLVPYKGTARQGPLGLAIVERVNAAIRRGDIFDAVVDFDRAMADPADPQRMRAELQKGDWLHPNDAGYQVMAAAIPASLFDAPADGRGAERRP